MGQELLTPQPCLLLQPGPWGNCPPVPSHPEPDVRHACSQVCKCVGRTPVGGGPQTSRQPPHSHRSLNKLPSRRKPLRLFRPQDSDTDSGQKTFSGLFAGGFPGVQCGPGRGPSLLHGLHSLSLGTERRDTCVCVCVCERMSARGCRVGLELVSPACPHGCLFL